MQVWHITPSEQATETPLEITVCRVWRVGSPIRQKSMPYKADKAEGFRIHWIRSVHLGLREQTVARIILSAGSALVDMHLHGKDSEQKVLTGQEVCWLTVNERTSKGPTDHVDVKTSFLVGDPVSYFPSALFSTTNAFGCPVLRMFGRNSEARVRAEATRHPTAHHHHITDSGP